MNGALEWTNVKQHSRIRTLKAWLPAGPLCLAQDPLFSHLIHALVHNASNALDPLTPPPPCFTTKTQPAQPTHKTPPPAHSKFLNPLEIEQHADHSFPVPTGPPSPPQRLSRSLSLLMRILVSHKPPPLAPGDHSYSPAPPRSQSPPLHQIVLHKPLPLAPGDRSQSPAPPRLQSPPLQSHLQGYRSDTPVVCLDAACWT
ncbi:hypothetical protein PTTG_10550 [Puccinia triticina 1-1 BBBD Race 1]|uniref:Uncharacterized protein n=2 Tax=Puccinia triticina TaxID=208348 RepID=A0A0C4FBF3_PUCT1|nr:uncharacterized protein PtA15_8A719 [Puccinia triticina]OAV86230.1 hypothetical protein PTTG_10550 [Puccinia triticina 1-1 BBBD Race 1]WAQ87812.1 hypothetical protein PtA15_8A719 [Puccinia triticina]